MKQQKMKMAHDDQLELFFSTKEPYHITISIQKSCSVCIIIVMQYISPA